MAQKLITRFSKPIKFNSNHCFKCLCFMISKCKLSELVVAGKPQTPRKDS